MPIERTESDKRLLQKYPIIYKRLFSSLLELTETHPKGVSVSELYAHINRVGRPSVIEEILDNVSWAISIGSCYLFSRNIVNQNAVSKADVETIDESTSTEEHSFSQEIFLVDFCGENNLSYTKPVGYADFGTVA